MTTIPLANNRGVTLVDDADAEFALHHTWTLKRGKNDVTEGYAWTRFEGSRALVYLHRVLCPGFPRVDHIDGNGLNNQRANLRGCTHQQNLWNQRPHNGKRFKGVYFINAKANQAKPWRAAHAGRFLGYFASPDEAARAVDAVALVAYGEFAWLNFPEEGVAQFDLAA